MIKKMIGEERKGGLLGNENGTLEWIPSEHLEKQKNNFVKKIPSLK